MKYDDVLKQAGAAALNQMMAWLKESAAMAKPGIVWAANQVPDVIRQYLTWMWWDNCLTVVYYVVIVAILVTFTVVLAKKSNQTEDEEMQEILGFVAVGSGTATLIMGVFALIDVMRAISTMIKISVAPKVVVLEKLAELIKK